MGDGGGGRDVELVCGSLGCWWLLEVVEVGSEFLVFEEIVGRGTLDGNRLDAGFKLDSCLSETNELER